MRLLVRGSGGSDGLAAVDDEVAPWTRDSVDAVLDLAAGRPGRRRDLPGGRAARRDRVYVRVTSSVETVGATMTRSPGCQSTGVETGFLSVTCRASMTRTISSKLRPTDFGYVRVRRTLSFGSMMKTERTVEVSPSPGWIMS